MKTAKKLIMVALVIFLAAPVLESCKKGPNDPGISMKSRKARLKGTWTTKSGSGSGTTSTSGWNDYNNVGLNGSTSTSQTYDGTNLTTITTANSVSNTTINGLMNDITFNSDGTYKIDNETVNTFEIPGWSTTTTTTVTTMEGTWNFTGGVGDEKSKQNVVINQTSMNSVATSVTTFDNGDPSETVITNESSTSDDTNGEIFTLDKLSSKEMVYMQTWSGSDTYETTEWNPNTGDNVKVTITDSWTNTSTWTMEKK